MLKELSSAAGKVECQMAEDQTEPRNFPLLIKCIQTTT